MPLSQPQSRLTPDRIAAVAEEARAELDATSQSLQEIGLLIHQTSSEVDRLGQRELQVANRAREMDANIEAYGRTDIRDMLRTAHDVELRLLMMRSQLEQLQEREASIRQYQEKLRIILDLADMQTKADEERQGTGELRTRALRRDATAILPTVPLGEVIQAAEDERLRVAQQIGDGPAQALADVLLEVEICERLFERDPEQAMNELGELRRVATKALADARRTLYELRPAPLRELGVVPTLRRYVTEVARQRPLEVNVIGPDFEENVPEVIRIALYRLLQGAISAAAADERVTRIDVDVRYEDAQVVARVEARGSELDRSQSLARFRTDEAVRHRLDQLGAELQAEIDGETTARLTLVIPLS